MKQRKINKYKESLNEEYDESQYNDNQDVIIPWKGIIFAGVLLIIGLFFIIKSYSLYSYNELDYSTFLPIFIMGWLAFIPGIYHLWIASQAYYHVNDYSFDDIPNFD